MDGAPLDLDEDVSASFCVARVPLPPNSQLPLLLPPQSNGAHASSGNSGVVGAKGAKMSSSSYWGEVGGKARAHVLTYNLSTSSDNRNTNALYRGSNQDASRASTTNILSVYGNDINSPSRNENASKNDRRNHDNSNNSNNSNTSLVSKLGLGPGQRLMPRPLPPPPPPPLPQSQPRQPQQQQQQQQELAREWLRQQNRQRLLRGGRPIATATTATAVSTAVAASAAFGRRAPAPPLSSTGANGASSRSRSRSGDANADCECNGTRSAAAPAVRSGS